MLPAYTSAPLCKCPIMTLFIQDMTGNIMQEVEGSHLTPPASVMGFKMHFAVHLVAESQFCCLLSAYIIISDSAQVERGGFMLKKRLLICFEFNIIQFNL